MLKNKNQQRIETVLLGAHWLFKTKTGYELENSVPIETQLETTPIGHIPREIRSSTKEDNVIKSIPYSFIGTFKDKKSCFDFGNSRLKIYYKGVNEVTNNLKKLSNNMKSFDDFHDRQAIHYVMHIRDLLDSETQNLEKLAKESSLEIPSVIIGTESVRKETIKTYVDSELEKQALLDALKVSRSSGERLIKLLRPIKDVSNVSMYTLTLPSNFFDEGYSEAGSTVFAYTPNKNLAKGIKLLKYDYDTKMFPENTEFELADLAKDAFYFMHKSFLR